jgi:zinc/manganese transport system substrate-binding protein
MTTLLGPGVDAHTYDPAPADLVTLEDADIVIENGLGFEPWLDQFFESAQPHGTRMLASEGIRPRIADELDYEEGDDHAEESNHDHGAFDPHISHDVANAVVIVENIRDAFVAADPANAAVSEANAAAKIPDLEALDAWVHEQARVSFSDTEPLFRRVGSFSAPQGSRLIGPATM